MACLKYDLNDYRVQYLVTSDEHLAKLINYIEISELVVEENGFQCLLKFIIGQQISDKARDTIWKKICLEFGNMTPQKLLQIEECALRQMGLTRRKVECIKALAREINEQKIKFEDFQILSNEMIIDNLTKIKGIGRWTVEMYLIFSLGREDILAKGDGTIKRTIQWMYGLCELPSDAELENFFEKWREYASIVSLFLWKSVALGLTNKPFKDAISGKK